jgi:hypothetical protein
MIMTEKHGRTMGPVDYLMVRFPGNKFTGKIAPELIDLEKRGIIRIIDLVFLLKDAKGNLMIIEMKDLGGEAGAAYKELARHTGEWFSEGDIEVISASLPDNTSAALMLFENHWAIRLKEALLNADAELIDMGRIPPEKIALAQKQLMMQEGA